MLTYQHDVYRTTATTTAAPLDLVVMLYQGALRFAQQGIQATERGDPAAAHSSFVRAQDVVAELMGSLNLDAGGEVAAGAVGAVGGDGSGARILPRTMAMA